MTTQRMKKRNQIVLLLLTCWIGLHGHLQAQVWTQKGADIDGEAAGDHSGSAVSMPDAHTIAIGAMRNSGSGTDAGHVRIYRWHGSGWVQKGLDIDGEAAGDSSGFALDMPDSNTVAIGAPRNFGTDVESGNVRVYRWNGSAWVQKGIGIDGEAFSNNSGFAVSMPDSNTVAIGAPYNDGLFMTLSGHVRIYSWNGSAWVQKGTDIDGDNGLDFSGWSVSMPDANTVAIGSVYFSGLGMITGQARIFIWNGTTWVQKGLGIEGEEGYEQSAYSLSMPDAHHIAIGAIKNDGNGIDAGHARVYRWDGNTWVQKGIDINGEAANDSSGYCVSMPDSNTLAIGAPTNDGNGFQAGHVRIYRWDGNAWVQDGNDIDGEAAGDQCGNSVMMPDAQTVAIGGFTNDGNGVDAGHVRVFVAPPAVAISPATAAEMVSAFPNPSAGKVSILLGKMCATVNVTVRNPLGQECQRFDVENTDRFSLNLEEPAGIYWVELTSEGLRTQVKIIKQ